MPGEILYSCDSCSEQGEGQCFLHNQIRLAKDGEWVCEECFDNGPEWTYIDKLSDEEDSNYKWSLLKEVPVYIPTPVYSKFRYKKRQSIYNVITQTGIVQTATPLTDEARVVIYKSEDGLFFIRPPDEFNDGRFEEIN